MCSRCCQTGLWHTRSRLVLIHFECELDAIIHVRREAISDAKESLRERVLVMACNALDVIPPQFGRVLVSANGSLEAVAMALSELSQRFEQSKSQHPAWASERWD